ncbi:MGDG synthase family glycosyltransferase [Aureibacillus halotolerans]|uniref:Monogalactosyldiacylglycerol synthase n=1 Tax=Aureibacillus halotolerans TaxID=1508390 RepID=A0A4R6TYM5_9BACI|nr:glycosyltransferase [Aureibacillus halotolerans]TDQ38691.1 monogalactosyldiacylglycerol synthase [Aureibacillus halotolerans]
MTVKKQTKIMILTGSYGNGHLQVVDALKKSFDQSGTDYVVVDLFQEAHPLMTALTKYLYIKSFTVGRRMYSFFYYSSKNMKHEQFITRLFNSFGWRKVRDLIETHQPDMIVNTFPMLAVPEYKRKTGDTIPTSHILTDYCLHNRWTHPLVDRYYVATEKLKNDLIQTGIMEASQVKVSGIPVMPSFEQKSDHQQLCQKYGFAADKKLVVIMAGAHGVLTHTDLIAQKLSGYKNSQLIIVCGHNHKLREKLLRENADNPDVVVLGYVNYMDDLMKVAEVMVTKPGGITLTEAINVRLPLVLYKAVPGQERENAEFFHAEEAAVQVDDIDAMIQATQRILSDDAYRAKLKANMAHLHCPGAGGSICNDIFETLDAKEYATQPVTFEKVSLL